jgi:ABC-type transport system involved in Fe-S cluster assembly fused permease/ATPase subunit
VESKGLIELCAPLSAWGSSENQAGGVSRHRKKGRKSMPLINILLTLIVVGVLLWLVNRFIPMQGTIKSILNAVVVIGVVLWLLDTFGLFHSLSRIRVGT